MVATGRRREDGVMVCPSRPKLGVRRRAPTPSTLSPRGGGGPAAALPHLSPLRGGAGGGGAPPSRIPTRCASRTSLLITMPRPQAVPHPCPIRRNSGVSRMSSGRSAPRSHSMISCIFPGRGDITTMRVDRYTASGSEWVTNTTVFFVLAHSASNCTFRWSRTISSSAPNGSSISSICG